MEDASKAKASIAALNDFNLKGSRIRVEVCYDSMNGFLYCLVKIFQLDINDTTSKCWSFIVRSNEEFARGVSVLTFVFLFFGLILAVEQNLRDMNRGQCDHHG